MAEQKMIFIGAKEAFIARVLIKKITDTGTECRFIPWTVSDISKNISGVSLIVLFMEDSEKPQDEVIHYLSDMMDEKEIRLVLVGEKADMQYVSEHISDGLVHATFTRPVDNTEFAKCITKYFKQVEDSEMKKSIMIVDDDPQYLTTVREWLKETYKVTMANSGLQAIKMLGKNKVDLILLDHEMPVTSGPQVLEMLRSDPETASIPVMFLTGKGDKESVMSVVALRPEGYFLKSIQKEELLTNLQEFFVLHR